MIVRRLTIALLAAALALVSRAWSSTSTPNEPEDDSRHRGPYIQGRNRTALFLANCEHGLANVHVATAAALLENYPDINVHYASFPCARNKIARVSRYYARPDMHSGSGDGGNNITFHELPGPSFEEAFARLNGGGDGWSMIHPPGLKGLPRFIEELQQWIAPWDVDEHMSLYDEMGRIIEDVDPAVIVLDTLFQPSFDITRDRHRQHAILTPNTLVDNFAGKQPNAAMLWKYPAPASGLRFPVPLWQIPQNLAINARFIYGALRAPFLRAKKAAVRARGIRNPMDVGGMHRDDVPWITMTTEGAAIPVDVVPPNVTCAGPIVLDAAPAAEQDAEMARWLKKAPTVLINLGSLVKYDQERASAMAMAIADVLDKTDVQIIWKFKKFSNFSEEILAPLTPFVDDGRLRMLNWLNVDPASLLNTGDIVASVHHGGSNCYHETVLAGVPHVILPLWADLYGFASLADDLGIGVWGCRATSPSWTADCLSDAILNVVGEGDRAASIRSKARRLGATVQSREKGRDVSAREIARLAYKK